MIFIDIVPKSIKLLVNHRQCNFNNLIICYTYFTLRTMSMHVLNLSDTLYRGLNSEDN